MPTISGRLIFDRNRTASASGSMPGISNVPIVLQNINTEATLAVLTNASGNYTFTNVPNGSYQIVESFGFEPAVATPADFSNAIAGTLLSSGVVPPIDYATNPPAAATHLDCTIKNTRLVTVAGSNLTDQNFLNGPVTYTPISAIMDSAVIVSADNLIRNADNGTFGKFSAGINANTGASPLPYTNLETDFAYVLPNPSTVTPNDGQFTIQNIMNNSYSNNVGTWWIVADRSEGNETGRMMVVNGYNHGAVIFKETVNVQPETYYLFSAWILNLCKRSVGYADPALGVAIFNEAGEIMYEATLGELIQIRTDNPEWKQIGTVFYTGANSVLTLQFVSMGPAATGNDYILDDISINEVIIPVYLPVKVANESFLKVGEAVEYTVTLENSGQFPLTDVVFRDMLPEGMEFVNESVFVNGVNMPSANPDSGFSVPDIEGGSTLTVTFSATAVFIPSVNPTLNQASITYTYSPVRGGIPVVHDTTTNEVLVEIIGDDLADLMIEKSAETSATIGQYLVYKLRIRNLGPSDAENAIVNDEIPSIILNAEYSTDDGATWDAWTGSFEAGTIESDASVELLIRGIVSQTTEPTVKNTATVNSETPDPNPDNNSSTIENEIVNPMSESADLAVRKKVAPSPCVAGERLQYTIEIQNYGPNDATDVMLTDNVPETILDPEFSTDGSQWQKWEGHHAVGTILSGAFTTIFIRGTVSPSATGIISNTAVVDSTTPDPDLTNNTSSVRTVVSGTIHIDKQDTINILIMSIGLEEIALAHILNAEGEKIQYILGTLEGSAPTEVTICDVLQVNDSVNQMLRNVLKTEMLLQFKFEDAFSLINSEE